MTGPLFQRRIGVDRSQGLPSEILWDLAMRPGDGVVFSIERDTVAVRHADPDVGAGRRRSSNAILMSVVDLDESH